MKENNINKQIPSKEEKLNRLKEMESKFQQEQVHKLHNCKSGADCPYEQAAIYTILLDLVQGNGKRRCTIFPSRCNRRFRNKTTIVQRGSKL